jgi:hypothetical protein
VAQDVRQGYVSIAAAAEHYGVVIEPATLAIDWTATEKLRPARRASRSRRWGNGPGAALPAVDPKRSRPSD